jgi:hypothetical protein
MIGDARSYVLPEREGHEEEAKGTKEREGGRCDKQENISFSYL